MPRCSTRSRPERRCWSCGAGRTPAAAAVVNTEAGAEPVADAAMLDTLPAGTAMLVVRRGPNAGSRFLLDSDLTLVGRHPDSDIFLDDVTVSRRHAEFYGSGAPFPSRDV